LVLPSGSKPYRFSAFRPASVIRTRATSMVLPHDALGLRGGEPGADKLDHLLDREAVREHHRFAAALAA
jgi:hypothetical protein